MTSREQQIQDVRILQKVNATHREAFAVKYPGQVEHCLRLTMERLQLGLDKRDGVVLQDPRSWHLTAGELESLANTAYLLNEIRRGF